MPPKKKGKGKKSKNQENRIDTLTEVDKTFYELQITDLNRKLARLKQTSQELEDKNIQLESKLENLDEDRADVISYLKRTVSTKQNESLELQDRVTALQESKDSEGKEYEVKIVELQVENKMVKEQLTSEIKLLSGKLNALEEFRQQRDDLMEKFEAQERTIHDQEIKEKKAIYEIEKKFIMSKKNIATEMEKQLFTLANNFEKANQVRIAATTQRCIRENIVLNNELNKMITTLENLNNQVEQYKAKNIELKLNCELYQAERNKTINELQVVRGHLDQMTKDFQSRVKILRSYEAMMKRSQKIHDEMKHTLAREAALAAKVRILEQNLHATRCKEIDLKQLAAKQNKLVWRFQEINREAVVAIEDCLNISLHPRLDEAGKQYNRELLLENLLTILTQPTIDTHTISSMETIDTIDSKYKRGDLGFMPKEVNYTRDKDVQVLNAGVQVTPRYEDEVYMVTPVQSYKSFRSIDSQSKSNVSSLTVESNNFLACSMLDVKEKEIENEKKKEKAKEKTRSFFSSVVLTTNIISEAQIEKLLAMSEASFMTLDSEESRDNFGQEMVEKNEGEDDEKEVRVIEVERRMSVKDTALKKEENQIQREAIEKEKAIEEEDVVVEEKPVDEDIENTVFDADDDDTEISSSSRND